MTRLVANSLSLERCGRRILNGVSLEASAGEFIVVIGPNGAGKSTLLSILAGLLKADSGRVTLDGRALEDYGGKELARRRAFLPQNPRCEWPIPVECLVALGLVPSVPAIGRLPRDHRDKIDAALAAYDLLPHRAQAATTLSGGELARAMQARALVGDPNLLIADEPAAGLDPSHALGSIRRLRHLADDGKLIIASMHDLNLGIRYATRIVAIWNGQIAADGPAQKTLTPELLQKIFDARARITGTGDAVRVDFSLLA